MLMSDQITNKLKKNTEELQKLLEDIILDFVAKKPNIINNAQRDLVNKEEMEREIKDYISIKASDMEIKQEDIVWLINNFNTYTLGWGVLQGLIDDDEISDVKIIDYNNIRIKCIGVRKKADVQFSSRESMKRFINMIAVRNGGSISEINAIQKISDTKSSDKFILRINITSEFINSVEHQYLVIRKIPRNKLTLEILEEKNMFSSEIYKYLMVAIKGDLTIITTGKGASGKTTLLNALLDEIPFEKSGLIIQEAEELYSGKHPDMMFQTIKYSKGESKIQYTLKDLAINGLLIDLDYFIIGEIKGEEAMDLINAIYTGHVGLSSVHGNSAREAVDKLIHYMKYVSDLRQSELLKLLSAIDIIIFMKDFKILEIVEVEGFDLDSKSLIFNPVFKYEVSIVDGKYKENFTKINDSCQKISDKLIYNDYKKMKKHERRKDK